MYINYKPFLLLTFFIVLFSSFSSAACTPVGTAGDDNMTCTGPLNGEKFLYGGNDIVELNNTTIGTGTRSGSFWLDESRGGNPSTILPQKNQTTFSKLLF